ncbi:hypothetical protein COCNU_16G002100 [Cocos nucifera]|uniref:C2 domain-containing protein n=1 Tax=Cocos nucifera TaxID=13894 RepID=A0A8K0IXV1_COCNU|nr:hypothetical protein COCNU_16G002100 [Cocos nucifera]
MGEAEAFSGSLLDIYVHHARNIHNICIYADQDVYAKFSLTCSPEEALPTRIVAGGGKNPQFDEHLRLKIAQPDAVLKCEIWMLSRAKNYLEDQLLGFTLVPLSSVAAAKGRSLTQDFTLSSTDLFHSPAGTVRLTLSLHTSLHGETSSSNSSISSEVVLLDPASYGRIEFPDINVVKENQKMVSEYFDMATPSRAMAAPFLHLGASPRSMEDYDMTVNLSEENNGGCDSLDGSIQNSGPFSNSTMTSLSDDKNSADSLDKKIRVDLNNSSAEANQSSEMSPDTPTSQSGVGGRGEGKQSKLSSKKEAESGDKEHSLRCNVEMGSVFKSPLGNIDLKAEQSAMQQQIVDMYMKSMQQFSESLAKMKLPMDLDKLGSKDGGDVIHGQNDKPDPQKKKDKSRVFYGSRAFF